MVDFPASYVSLPEAMRRQKISQDAAAATSHNIVFFFFFWEAVDVFLFHLNTFSHGVLLDLFI